MTDSDYISGLLAAEQAEAPPSGSTEAGLQRLLGTMATHAAPLPVAVGSLKLGLGVITKWVGVGFLVGTLGAGAASYASHPASRSPMLAAPAAELAVAPPVRLPAAAETAAPAPASSATLDPVSNDAKRTAAVSRAAAPAAPVALASPSVTPAFDEELRLITAAKHELDLGRGHLARVWLDEHRQRFPRGVFSLEREGLLVLTSCSASPNPLLARQFASQHPDSPMLEQVLRRCRAEDPSNTPAPASGNLFEGDK